MSEIIVSDSAKEQLKHLMKEENASENLYKLRVSVEGGGCSGLSYKLDFTDEWDENGGDKFFTDNEINMVINVKSLLYLIGTTLDYTSGLNGKGFEFKNPNATRTCGCGESFSI
jgi:iron-sulfur cluster assembly protein